jgi:hypothetical protein
LLRYYRAAWSLSSGARSRDPLAPTHWLAMTAHIALSQDVASIVNFYSNFKQPRPRVPAPLRELGF